MYLDQPVQKFLDDLAARTPTPGGGSTSALAGALGAALGCMSAVFTTGNEKFAAVEPQVRELLAQLEASRGQLAGLIQQDIQAYEAYSAARKLPRETDAQKAARKSALAQAQELATAVPETIVAAAGDAQALVLKLAPLCNPNLAGDVAVAGYLLEAAARGAAIQVQCNLSGPQATPADAARRAVTHEKAEACRRMAVDIERKVMETLGLLDETR